MNWQCTTVLWIGVQKASGRHVHSLPFQGSFLRSVEWDETSSTWIQLASELALPWCHRRFEVLTSWRQKCLITKHTENPNQGRKVQKECLAIVGRDANMEREDLGLIVSERAHRYYRIWDPELISWVPTWLGLSISQHLPNYTIWMCPSYSSWLQEMESTTKNKVGRKPQKTQGVSRELVDSSTCVKATPLRS